MAKPAVPEGPPPPPPAPVGGEGATAPGQGAKGPERRKASLRIEKDKKAPAVELEAFKKSKDFALGNEFLQEQFTEDVVAEHLPPFKKKPHELPEDFAARRERQILSEVDKRVTEPTAYAPDDWVRNILDTNTHIPPRQLSKVIEAKLLTLDVQERVRAESAVREMFAGSPQSKVLTEVGELEAYDQAEAPYMSYYGEGKEMAPEAKLDQVAFRLFEDTLSDVVDPTLAVSFTNADRYPGVHSLLTEITSDLATNGKPASYRNIRRVLSERFRNAQTDQDRFLLRETFWAVRGRQYENMKIALEQVQRNVIGAPQGRATLHGNFLNPTAEQMAEILSEIDTSKGGLENLIDSYQGFANTETGRTHEREDIRANLDNLVTNPFDLALKWEERMERAVVEPFKPKETPMVTGRRFKEGPQGEEGEEGEPGKRKIGEPPEKPEKEKIGEPPEPVTPPGLEPAPVPEPEPVKEPLETGFHLGTFADTGRRSENVKELTKHDLAHDLARKPVPWYARPPIIGKVLWILRHPIQLGWQNAIARSVFEQHHLRFASDVVAITKQGAETSIPLEVQHDLIDRVMEAGRERMGQQNAARRLVWVLSDYAKGLTGISQTSWEKYGKEWLQEQLQLPQDQRDPEVQRIYQRYLEEQDRAGNRYSHLPEGMTVEQANRLVIAREAGETRHGVRDETLRAAANTKLKGLIEQYANGQLTEAQLVAETNHYLMGDFRNGLTGDEQKEFTAPEVVSNILSIARKVTGRDQSGNIVEPDRWHRYQTEKGEGERTKWEEVEINVLFGKGEFDPARGKVELGFLTNRLSERLANRELNRGTGTMAAAVGLAKDAASFGGAYAAGWGLSGILFGQNTLVRAAGGVGGVAFMAAVKETGIDLSRFGRRGIKGRYREEVEQHSKESAKGRAIPHDARIRQEMDQALVDRVRATDQIALLEPQLAQQQLTETQAQDLLVHLAELDARLRLTDLSGSRQLNFKVQNYIEFTQGQANEEYDHLRGTLLRGLAKIQAGQPNLGGGQPLFTQEGIRYDIPNHPLGLFDKYSALAEAQLRVSSNTDQVRQWLTRELQLDNATVNAMMTNLFGNINENIQQEDSLRGKERTLQRLRIVRGIATAKDTVLLAGFMGAAVQLPAEAISGAGQVAREGLGGYFNEWSRVASGDVPVTIVNGHPVADLTPFQRGVLEARAFIENPPFAPHLSPTHPVPIDGVQLNLAQELHAGQTPGGGNYLVDARTGQVHDLTNYTMAARDLNGDGTPDLALIDKQTGSVVDARQVFGTDVAVANGPDLTKTVTSEVLVSSGSHVDKTFGVEIRIPNGTEWAKDANGHWNLVVSAHPDKILITNAHIDTQGHVGADYVDTSLAFSAQGAAPEVIAGSQTEAHWAQLGTKLDHREWYSYDQPGSQGNELRFYTYKQGDTVILDMSAMKDGYQRGLIPNPIHVPDVIQKQEAVFAFSIPGHGGQPVLIHAGLDGKFALDPHSTAPLPGTNLTVGDFSRMVVNQDALTKLPDGNIATELRGHQDVFNLGLHGQRGFIEAGRFVEGTHTLQAFATITGTGDAKIEVPGTLNIAIDLAGKITETHQEKVPTFILTASSPLGIDLGIPLIPYAGRQNIEKSRRPGQEPPVKEGAGGQPPGESAEEGARVPPKNPPLTATQEARRQELEKRRDEGKDFSDEDREELEKLTALAKAAEEEKRRQEQEDKEPQPLQEQGATPLERRFAAVKGTVDNNHPYFVENPPDRINLSDQELQTLAIDSPFFEEITQLPGGGWSRYPSRSVMPWVPLMEGAGMRRFLNGEASTGGDSGLFGLAANASGAEANQARLYGALSDAILRHHEQDPLALTHWASQQGGLPTNLNELSTSLAWFRYHDYERVARHADPRDAANESLFIYTPSNKVNFQATTTLWHQRIQDLRSALDNNQLTADHLRWIEFLSHSVDVPKLIELAQEQQPTPPSVPPTTTTPPITTVPTGTGEPPAATEPLEATAQTTAQELNTNLLNEVIEKSRRKENGQAARLGIEVDFTPEEIAEMHRLIEAAQSIRVRLANEQQPQWGHFQAFLERRRKQLGTFDEARYIIADPDRTTVYWGSNADGIPTIAVPTTMRNLYDAENAIDNAQRDLREYEAGVAHARLAHHVGDNLEKVLQFTQENSSRGETPEPPTAPAPQPGPAETELPEFLRTPLEETPPSKGEEVLRRLREDLATRRREPIPPIPDWKAGWPEPLTQPRTEPLEAVAPVQPAEPAITEPQVPPVTPTTKPLEATAPAPVGGEGAPTPDTPSEDLDSPSYLRRQAGISPTWPPQSEPAGQTAGEPRIPEEETAMFTRRGELVNKLLQERPGMDIQDAIEEANRRMGGN